MGAGMRSVTAVPGLDTARVRQGWIRCARGTPQMRARAAGWSLPPSPGDWVQREWGLGRMVRIRAGPEPDLAIRGWGQGRLRAQTTRRPQGGGR